ncbi:MAG TPA: hypothetical protein VN922_22670 [Bacteroidia bacterium]|nr:hypothetical protein [Bacteroidia bacterium]
MSFSKRKYTKGEFFNSPDNKNKVSAKYIALKSLKTLVKKDENISQNTTDLSFSIEKESSLTSPFNYSISKKQSNVNIKAIEKSVSNIIEYSDTAGRETMKAHGKKAPAIIAGSIGIASIVLGTIFSASSIGLVCILLGAILLLAGLNELFKKPIAEVPSVKKASSTYDNSDDGTISPSEPSTVSPGHSAVASRKSKTAIAGVFSILLGLILFVVGAAVSDSGTASLAGVILPFEAGFVFIILGLILLIASLGIKN